MAFGRYPITIYDLKVKVLLSTVIPFAFASFYPTTLALKRTEFAPVFWAVPVVALLFVAPTGPSGAGASPATALPAAESSLAPSPRPPLTPRPPPFAVACLRRGGRERGRGARNE